MHHRPLYATFLTLSLLLGASPLRAQTPDGGVPDGGADGGVPDGGADGGVPDGGADGGVPDGGGPEGEPEPEPESPVEPEPEPEPDFDDGFSDEEMAAELDALDAEAGDEPDRAPPAATPTEDDFSFDEIVVSYAPDDVFERAGSGTVLSEEQLEAMGYDDPHAMLRQVPGVYVRNEDGFGLRPNIGMRGVNPERSKKITLLEDGVLFGPAPYSAPAAYYFPLMARMTSVEVLKGAAALLHGPQTVAGAIDFHTREIPTDAEGGADIAFGRFRTRRLHLHYGASNRWGGFLFEGLDVASAGFKAIDDSNRETGFQRTDFMVRGFLQTDPTDRVYQRLSLKLGLGRERSDETYLGLTDEDFREDPYRRYAASANDRMAWWRTQVVLTHRVEVGERFQVTTDLYRHDFDRSWNRANRFAGGPLTDGTYEGVDLRGVLLYPNSAATRRYASLLAGTADADPTNPAETFFVVDNHRRYVSQGVQSRFRASFGDDDLRHTLQVGVRLHHDGVERDHVEEGFLLTRGALVPADLPPNQITRNLAETIAGSGYAAYALQWRRLTLTPGIRAEVIHTHFEDALDPASAPGDTVRAIALPGVGVEYEVLPKTDVFAGVHRGFSPVAPDNGGGVDPETSIAYELGARHVDKDEGRHLELVGFLNDYDNLLSQCSFSASCDADMIGRQFNGGRVLVWGAEVTAGWRFALGDDYAVPAQLVYTYTDSRFGSTFTTQDPTLGGTDQLVEEGDRLPYVPRHSGQLQVGLEHRLFAFRVSGTYVGESLEEAGQGQLADELRTDSHFLLDASVEVEPEEHVRVYARFQNILNQAPVVSRRPFGARTIPPFTFLTGVEATF